MKKQEERKDQIKEGTESSLRHFLCRKEINSKRATGQSEEHLNGVQWVQGVTIQPGTKLKEQQEWSKQPRD